MADEHQGADTPRDHVEMTVQRMAELHAQQLETLTPLQRRVSWLVRMASRPGAVAAASMLMLLWIAFNAAAPLLGIKPFDGPPFNLLELVATVVALIATLMILASQAREEEATRHRSQLTLQLASLSEQKIAKVIRLLEEQRKENPQLPTRPDPEAEAMAQPADPGAVLERIKATHES